MSGDAVPPAQAPYVGCRGRRTDTNRSWVALNRRPATSAAQHHLDAR
ncbi:hypothetical protein [Micromonospora cathayae]|uniref:Uncharacterized protein n=1 Tax=Micromonospora cathayae TaxID=3028804 RepID=A0ABY7ZW53_9ACTN|nr:hypothetical protein [Micromonospora sp. HUAS 3]WDZ87291.1 hypothetical protein PVK37_13220 [Micromonospora sp. HUAS 3]